MLLGSCCLLAVMQPSTFPEATQRNRTSTEKTREGRRVFALLFSVQDLMSQPLTRMMSRTLEPLGPADEGGYKE